MADAPHDAKLADRLLELIERDAVIKYLEACREAGWKEPRIGEWISDIQRGKLPTFPPETYLF